MMRWMNADRIRRLAGTAGMMILAAALVTGCSSGSSEKSEETAAADATLAKLQEALESTTFPIENASDYVTLGGYKGLTIDKNVYDITDDEVEYEIYERSYDSAETVDVTDTAEYEDELSLDMSITINGQTTDQKDVYYYLGNAELGSEFDEHLAGAKIGEEITFSISYDEDTVPYGYETWQDETVGFAVTVVSATRTVLPEIDDDYAKELGFEDLDAYREYIRTSLEDEYAANSEEEACYTAVDEAEANAEFAEELPQDLLSEMVEQTKKEYVSFAEMYEMSTEELYEMLEITDDDLTAEAEDTLSHRLFLSALCEDAGITLTADDLEGYADTYASGLGFSDADEMLADESVNLEALVWSAVEVKAGEYIISQGTINEVTDSVIDGSYMADAYDEDDYEVLEGMSEGGVYDPGEYDDDYYNDDDAEVFDADADLEENVVAEQWNEEESEWYYMLWNEEESEWEYVSDGDGDDIGLVWDDEAGTYLDEEEADGK